MEKLKKKRRDWQKIDFNELTNDGGCVMGVRRWVDKKNEREGKLCWNELKTKPLRNTRKTFYNNIRNHVFIRIRCAWK